MQPSTSRKYGSGSRPWSLAVKAKCRASSAPNEVVFCFCNGNSVPSAKPKGVLTASDRRGMNDKHYARPRRLLREALGTAILIGTAVGSGITAERLAGGNQAVALLATTVLHNGIPRLTSVCCPH